MINSTLSFLTSYLGIFSHAQIFVFFISISQTFIFTLLLVYIQIINKLLKLNELTQTHIS